MIDLEETPDRILMTVKARAGAARNAITGAHDGMLKVAVTQAPEKGKANQAIVKLMAKELDLPKSQISLISGQTTPLKKFMITGSTLSDLRRLTARWE